MTKILINSKNVLIVNSGIKTAIEVFGWISLISLIVGISVAIYDFIFYLFLFIGFLSIPYFIWYSSSILLLVSILSVSQIALYSVSFAFYFPYFKRINSGVIPIPDTKLWIAVILNLVAMFLYSYTFYIGVPLVVLIILLYVATSK